MACPYEEKLTSWLLGDLSPKEQDDVTRHLFTCSVCRQESDVLRRVLFPLRSALHKDQRLFNARPMSSSWTGRFRLTPWMRSAALLVLSGSVVLLAMTLYHQQLSRRHDHDGPVTHITFGKMETPPPPLEPVVLPKTPELDLLADLNIAKDLGLEQITYVPPPALPGAYWTPKFVTLNQLATLHSMVDHPESVHDRLMRQLPEARWDAQVGPLCKPPRSRQPRPLYGPTVYASPRYSEVINSVKTSEAQP
jgi:hypothetical protein